MSRVELWDSAGRVLGEYDYLGGQVVRVDVQAPGLPYALWWPELNRSATIKPDRRLRRVKQGDTAYVTLKRADVPKLAI